MVTFSLYPPCLPLARSWASRTLTSHSSKKTVQGSSGTSRPSCPIDCLPAPRRPDTPNVPRHLRNPFRLGHRPWKSPRPPVSDHIQLLRRKPEMTRALQITQRFQERRNLKFSSRVPESELTTNRSGQSRTGTRPFRAELALHRSELRRLGEGFLDRGASPARAGGLAGSAENVQTYLWGLGRASPFTASPFND